jgi:amino acid transporter
LLESLALLGKQALMEVRGYLSFFLFTALACTLPLLHEFASMVPVSGSAYTYSYVAFGELIADHRLGANHGICY